MTNRHMYFSTLYSVTYTRICMHDQHNFDYPTLNMLKLNQEYPQHEHRKQIFYYYSNLKRNKKYSHIYCWSAAANSITQTPHNVNKGKLLTSTIKNRLKTDGLLFTAAVLVWSAWSSLARWPGLREASGVSLFGRSVLVGGRKLNLYASVEVLIWEKFWEWFFLVDMDGSLT